MTSLEKKVALFSDKSFVFEGKVYRVKSAEVKAGKAILKTDKRTFVNHESELDKMLEVVVFKHLNAVAAENAMQHHENNENGMLVFDTPHWQKKHEKNGISNLRKTSDALMLIFDDIKNGASKEKIDQAISMVKVSDAIVRAEMVEIQRQKSIE